MARLFDCSACGIGYEGDIRSKGAADCTLCFRIGCTDCLDEKGNCVPCGEKSAQKTR